MALMSCGPPSIPQTIPFMSCRPCRSRFRVALCLVTLGVCTATAWHAPLSAADPLDDYKLAVGLYNQGRWKLAAESFQAFVQKNAKHPKAETARYYLGLTYVNLEDHKQARDTLRAFVRDYPKSSQLVQAAYWIGQSSYLLDDFPAAETELSAFADKAPGDPLLERALPYLGDVELRLNKPDQAATRFQQALKQFPQGVMAEDAKFGLARSYELQKKNAEAVKLYQELAVNRTGSRAAEAQLNLGARMFDDGNFAGAAQAYAKLEKDFPESPLVPLAALNHGFASYQAADFRQAIAEFEKASKEPKHTLDAALWTGLSYKSLSLFPEAIAVLKPAYEKFREDPNGEKLIYQWAECEQRAGAFDRARELYVEAVDRYPKGPLADSSLHAACVAALNGGKLPEAETLLARFDKQFPGNKLRFRQDVLKGRLLLAKNDDAGAAKQLTAALAASDVVSTKSQARYYLAAAEQKLGHHDRVVEVSTPLISDMEQDKSLAAEFSGIHVVRGASLLALGKVAEAKPEDRKVRLQGAVESAQKYLSTAPKGDVTEQALVIKSLAEAHLGNKAAAKADLEQLKKRFPNSPELERTLFETGQSAFGREDWEWARSMFAELAARPKESRFHARSLSELGWTEYKQQHFKEAADSFGRLLQEHPEDTQAPEAAFMRGTALQDQNRLEEAVAAFSEGFQKFGTSEHAFLSGLQRARILGRLKKIPEADTAYEELLKRFPSRKDADKVLDEWATTNYDAEQYTRADQIFRRLVQEHPSSELADNAQLSLAESELLGGKLDEARKQFTALASSSAADMTVQQRALFQVMLIELELKRWDDLRKAAENSLMRFPEGAYHWDAEFHWAEADFQLGAYKEARDRLEKLKSHHTDKVLAAASWFPRVWVILAETQFRLKQYPEVAAASQEFHKVAPKSPLLYQVDEVYGRSLKAQAKLAEARKVFEAVVEDESGRLTETAAKSQFQIAETYVLEKNYKRALLEYLKVEIRYKFPEWQAPALYQAGVCHEALSEWKEAAKTFENVVKNYPQSEYAPKAREQLEIARRKASG